MSRHWQTLDRDGVHGRLQLLRCVCPRFVSYSLLVVLTKKEVRNKDTSPTKSLQLGKYGPGY